MNINWSKIKYFFADAAIWMVAHWWILIVVAAFLAVVLIVGQVQSCNEGKRQKKIDDTKTNITTGKVESNVAANQVNAAANVSNQSLENVNKVKQQNINSVSNDYNEARRRYCAEFPEDCR